VNLYQIKRTLLTPYIAYMRRKESHQTDAFIKSALELYYYRPTFYRFIRAHIANPEILYDVPINPGSVVLDVGAHVGDWAAKMRKKYDARMYLFEPDPASIPRLRMRFKDDPKITLFDVGLHDHNAELAMEQKGLGSTVFPDGQSGGYPVVHVRLRDVAEVLEELKEVPIDLFKINIEGGEYEVLERLLDSFWINRIRCIMIQYHEWRDGAHFRRWKIQREMRRTHRLAWDYPFVWELWTRR
jgi:FkbM family methyltransferase